MSDTERDPTTRRRVIAAVPDLFFLTRIQETARAAGITLEAVPAARVLAACREGRPDLVVLDLTDPADTVAVAAALRAEPATRELPIVGFYPHVDTALRDRALAAGVTRVLPRSAFTARMAEWLAGREA